MAKDIYLVRPDGGEILLSSSLSSGDIEELWEWCCCTKPIGPSVRMAFRQDSRRDFCVTATGTKLESSARARLAEHREVYED